MIPGQAISPAPNLTALYEIEQSVEGCLQAILTESPFNVPRVYTNREVIATDSGKITYPSIALKFELGAESGINRYPLPQSLQPTNGATHYKTAWDFSFVVSCAACRHPDAAGNLLSIDTMKAFLMALFDYYSDTFSVENLPFHNLVKYEISGISYEYRPELDVDVCDILLTGCVGIRPEAFPVALVW